MIKKSTFSLLLLYFLLVGSPVSAQNPGKSADNQLEKVIEGQKKSDKKNGKVGEIKGGVLKSEGPLTRRAGATSKGISSDDFPSPVTSELIQLFGRKPVFLLHLKGVALLLKKLKSFANPLFSPSEIDMFISEKFRELFKFFGNNVTSIESLFSSMGISPSGPLFLAVFGSEGANSFHPFQMVALFPLENRDKLLRTISKLYLSLLQERCRNFRRKLQNRLRSYRKLAKKKRAPSLSKEELLKKVLNIKAPYPCGKLDWFLSPLGDKIDASNWSELRKFATYKEVYRDLTVSHYRLDDNLSFSITDRLVIFSALNNRDLALKVAKKIAVQTGRSGGKNLIVTGGREGYIYYNFGEFLSLLKASFWLIPDSFDPAERARAEQMVKIGGAAIDFLKGQIRGLEEIKVDIFISSKEIKLLGAMNYGSRRSNLVEKVYTWKSKPLASKRLLPPNIFLLFSINSIPLLFSTNREMITAFRKDLNKFVPPENSSQISLALMMSLVYIQQFQEMLKDEVTAVIAASDGGTGTELSFLHGALFVQTPKPELIIRQLSPLILRFFPGHTASEFTYRKIPIRVFELKSSAPGKSRGTAPSFRPFGTIAITSFGYYAIFTYTLGPKSAGISFIKSILDRAFSTEDKPTSRDINSEFSGNFDFLFTLSFNKILQFLRGNIFTAPLARDSGVLRIIKFFDRISLRFVNKPGNKGIYRQVFVIRKR